MYNFNIDNADINYVTVKNDDIANLIVRGIESTKEQPEEILITR